MAERLGPFLLTYFNYAGKETKLQLPVAPTQVSVKYSHEFSDFTIVNLGEAALRGGDKLAEITLQGFFIGDYNSSLLEPEYLSGSLPLLTPVEYEKIIHEIRIVGKPCLLTIGGTFINAPVMIRSFDTENRGGEPGDLYYTLSFKKHRPINVTMEVSSTKTERPPAKPTPKTYTVVSGDNLWAIAKKTLGDGSRNMEIYNLNKGVIGSNPNLIYPGQVLTLPNTGGGSGAPSLANAK